MYVRSGAFKKNSPNHHSSLKVKKGKKSIGREWNGMEGKRREEKGSEGMGGTTGKGPHLAQHPARISLNAALARNLVTPLATCVAIR